MAVQRLITIPERLAERARRLAADPSSGYDSFNELVVDALSQLLVGVESGTDDSDAEGARPETGGPASADRQSGARPPAGALGMEAPSFAASGVDLSSFGGHLGTALIAAASQPSSLSATRLSAVRGLAFEPGAALPTDAPAFMFSFHNRDYPSLWALRVLAEASVEGPVSWSDFETGLALAAFSFGEGLRLLDASVTSGLKPSLMFPRPSVKRGRRGKKSRSSSRREFLSSTELPQGWDLPRVRMLSFVSHSVGKITRSKGSGQLEARGPLSQWGAIAFAVNGDGPQIGPTASGLQLLESLDGISLELPHSEEQTKKFLDFLAANAPKDLDGFLGVMRVIASSPDREALNEKGARELGFTEEGGRARGTIQGYVSRCREWGLVEPRLGGEDGRRYELTDSGRSVLDERS